MSTGIIPVYGGEDVNSDRFVERTIGVAVELNDGKRTFYTVYDEEASMVFEADGSLVIAPCK